MNRYSPWDEEREEDIDKWFDSLRWLIKEKASSSPKITKTTEILNYPKTQICEYISNELANIVTGVNIGITQKDFDDSRLVVVNGKHIVFNDTKRLLSLFDYIKDVDMSAFSDGTVDVAFEVSDVRICVATEVE